MRFPIQTPILTCLFFSLIFPAQASVERLLGKQVELAPQGGLVNASGAGGWAAGDTGRFSGLAVPKVNGRRIGGMLTRDEARLTLDWPEPGADLDLGFNDFLDLELQLPAGFDGQVRIEYNSAQPRGGETRRIELPASRLKADGRIHRYRLDLGLVPGWRGFLSQAALVISPGSASAGKAVVAGAFQIGDRPGDEFKLNTQLNLKEGMTPGELKKMESKHACIWWHPEREEMGFDPEVMPRRALRMIEETRQVAVNLLGYRDPCLGHDLSNPRPAKINHITWYDGFWMGADENYPHFNVSEGGLLDENWGNPVPHEFAHCVQSGQVNFLRGSHWESHANYIRFHRNLHFRDFVDRDSMPFHVLPHSNYYQDHPKLIYADFRPYFYLDSDPDRLGFEPGLTAKLWQTGRKDDLLWDRLPNVLPDGVTRETVAAGIARSWVTFDFVGGERHREAYFTGDRAGALRKRAYYTPLEPVAGQANRFEVPLAKAPMKFGWCVHDLRPTGPVIQAKLDGIDIAGPGEDWRWGFVAFRKDGTYMMTDIFKPGPGRLELPADVGRVALFVCATPEDPTLNYDRATPELAMDRHPDRRRYPYEVLLDGAVPAGHTLDLDLPAGSKHRNGGGFVAASAKVDAAAYVGPDARVLDNARVLGKARVLDHAVVMGEATVRDEAVVSGGAIVHGRAIVSDRARVRGFAVVGGEAKVREDARVADFAQVEERSDIHGKAIVRGTSSPFGNGRIGGHAILDGDYSMAFDLEDGVHFHHVPWGAWYFDEFAARKTLPRGLVVSLIFEEKDGGQALDEFGALHATLHGEPVREKRGGMLNGKDQFVSLDRSITDSRTATWVIDAACSGRGTQPVFTINDWQEDGLMIGLGAGGHLAAVLKREGGRPLTLASTKPVARGAEFRVALRLDGERAALFLNGVKVAEGAWPHPAGDFFRDVTSEHPTTAYLGRDGERNHMAGRIHGFRAYQVALSDGELAAE